MGGGRAMIYVLGFSLNEKRKNNALNLQKFKLQIAEKINNKW